MPLMRRYRLLLIVVGLTSFSFWWEWSDPAARQRAVGGPPKVDAYAISQAFEQIRRDEMVASLYPDRPEILFERGQRAVRAGNDQAARDFFERAIRSGIKTSEDLYYEHVRVLIRLKAPQAEIDAAAETWRRLFPLTKLADPRTVKDADELTGQRRKKMWVGE